MSLYDRNDLEEERRLFYVAITRAKEKLWISFANNRYRFGNLIQNDPSRFIEELPKELVDDTQAIKPKQKTLFASPNQGGASRNDSNSVQQKKPVLPPKTNLPPIANFQPDDPATFETGMSVLHQRFGQGKIIQMEGPAANKIATIDFGTMGQKKIMLNYAKLQRIS